MARNIEKQTPSILEQARENWSILFSKKAEASELAKRMNDASKGAGEAVMQLLFLSREDFAVISVKDNANSKAQNSTKTCEEILAVGLADAAFAESTFEDVRSCMRRFARLDVVGRTKVLSSGATGINKIKAHLKAAEQTATGGDPKQPGTVTTKIEDWTVADLSEIVASVTKTGDAILWRAIIEMIQDIGIKASAKLLEVEAEKIDAEQSASRAA